MGLKGLDWLKQYLTHLEMSTYLTVGLTLIYMILVLTNFYEGNKAKSFYWLGASIINTSILFMKG